jgi:K+-sensing histidine kinase KdpD
MTVPAWLRRDLVLVVAALIAPLVAAVALVPFRGGLASADAALVLVLVVVAVAAAGHRLAGVVAALSAGLCFDFFLIRPYGQFAINRREDVETTVLLLLVGIAVTGIAAWGRRQQALASKQAGYLAGIQDAAESVAPGTSPAELIDQVCQQITRMLHLRSCEFDYGTGVVGGDRPRLRQDGQVQYRGSIRDVEREGLPTDREIELLLGSASYRGRFVLVATPESRPSIAQRLVAVALADRVAAVLSDHRST